ncbi:hypothetical protein C9J85_03580 [Haloferax sp. wsp5]|nr:hypothetical protein C9J85_03580 [Haloferax sp. wsp5]
MRGGAGWADFHDLVAGRLRCEGERRVTDEATDEADDTTVDKVPDCRQRFRLTSVSRTVPRIVPPIPPAAVTSRCGVDEPLVQLLPASGASAGNGGVYVLADRPRHVFLAQGTGQPDARRQNPDCGFSENSAHRAQST